MPNLAPALARGLNRALSESTTVVRLLPDLSRLAPREVALRCRVVRPADLFTAEFAFHNLRLETNHGARLVRRKPSSRAHVVMELQGQHFGEQVLKANDQGAPEAPPAPPKVLMARLAYPSRIAVTMPDRVPALNYTLEALLEAITTWPPSLDVLAHRWTSQAAAGAAVNYAGAVDLLRGWAGVFEAALADREAGALAPMVANQAEQTATQTIDAVRRNARPAIARQATDHLRAELARDRALDDDTRELALAAFEVRVAEKTIEHLMAHPFPGIALERLLEAAGAIRLLVEPHPLGDAFTALELPYRLIHSPHADATFVHPDSALTLSGRTELWRTTLARRSDYGPKQLDASGAPVTVMWSPDYADVVPPEPFPMALKPYQRKALVRLMSGYLEMLDGGLYRPAPATVRRLQLSAWGGVLELDGAWDERPKGVDVEAWNHDASYGRDERVRVVEAGYLYPYGHRASLITLTERRVDAQKPSGVAGFLRQRQFIVVREFVKDFPVQEQQYHGRKLPFTRITCLTRQTPDLYEFDPVDDLGVNPEQPSERDRERPNEDPWPETLTLWPMVSDSTPAPFEFEAVDLAGRRIAFTSPAIFLFKSFVDDAGGSLQNRMDQVDRAWSRTEDPRAAVGVGGQLIRMAPPAPGGDAVDVDIDIPVDEIVFEATLATRLRPPFHPAFREATVRIRALDAVTDRECTVPVEYEPDTYLPCGYDANANPWRVFLKLKKPHLVSMGGNGGVSSDRVGGIGQPSQMLSAISNGWGAVSGTVASLIAGRVAPTDMFPEAKILGGFDLKDLVGDIVAGDARTLPGYRTEEHPDRIVTIWAYGPEELEHVPDAQAQKGLVIGAGNRTSELTLSAQLTTYIGGNPPPNEPEAVATGRLTNFKLDYDGFVIVWFDEFSFTSCTGKKLDSRPTLNAKHPVVFGGPLEFVNTLSKIIPAGGFTGRPIIRPSPTDLTVGYDFELPSIEVGIFALKNVLIGALLRIPFTGEPVALRFYFSKRESPFLLTVSMFGGGGFFDIVTTAKGVQAIEAAFEFGAYAQLSVGVASGGVYVKAGVYFHWRSGVVELEGYVEMGGELSLLGIVSVSITLHLALGYEKVSANPLVEGSGHALVRGQAKLVIEVSLLFFSVSVKALIERRFAGSSADPTFADLITESATWARYCGAFA